MDFILADEYRARGGGRGVGRGAGRGRGGFSSGRSFGRGDAAKTNDLNMTSHHFGAGDTTVYITWARTVQQQWRLKIRELLRQVCLVKMLVQSFECSWEKKCG